ncbi:Ku70/Ku80 N-terminal alpha/beta domain-containing protein [Xylaria bambusicola]|uniref:Ku70/Ku80 N-terminal alpha/beta domain-containing protein n=1 Tax=Xylaria bambusicola TaxID=326684 RepID=UPI002008A325|nr:Ku70/Ku80 N-terminal alpha/beta domain-containing protein [Xylaria bambusicola]KAI0528068.1 Ku70/Ku80 N-terminal alpha/beta domain-containing protein [Xylaria bambusicola]
MADKEATIYLLDLGSSMADCHNGRTESDLDWSMRYVWDKISTTVAASRKTWNVGVIGVKTDETDNPLDSQEGGGEGYEHISVLQELGPMTMGSLTTLRDRVKASDTQTGDAISAIVLAVEMIEKFTKKLKYNRRIILVTDGEAPMDNSDIDDIAEKIKRSGIQLTVLGVDFDDSEYGFKEEDKSSIKEQNEVILRDLVEKCDGLYGTIAEAIAELETPRVKSVKPYKTYDGLLTLGDPSVHEDAMSINVERYFKTHKATVPPASRVVMKTESSTDPSGATDGDEMQGVEPTPTFSAVKDARTYKVNDPDAPGGKRDVDRDDLAKGYEYGRTAVHISESDYNITKIETTKSFSIVGFIYQEKYEPFLNMGETCMTVAQKFNDAAALKLSSLIHSLHELESYAVARIVTKDGKEPVLILLAPHIEPDFECLYDVPLPFAEDVRNYPFPPLDKVITVQGTTITENHRNLPSLELQEAMDDYVDAMDISSWGKDDEGARTIEYAAVEDLFSPPLHRINQVIRHRATYPTQPVPPTPAILLKYANPPEDLVAKARSDLEDLIDKASVKKVPPKAQGRKAKGDKPKPISGLDIDALLKQPENKRAHISPDKAIPEFKQKVEIADDQADIEDAMKQMGAIIRGIVTKSFGDQDYERVVEHIGVMKETAIDYEYPDLFNSFMVDFKSRLLSGEFDGNRRELWWKIKSVKLGLIDDNASEPSKVTPEEAAAFFKT